MYNRVSGNNISFYLENYKLTGKTVVEKECHIRMCAIQITLKTEIHDHCGIQTSESRPESLLLQALVVAISKTKWIVLTDVFNINFHNLSSSDFKTLLNILDSYNLSTRICTNRKGNTTSICLPIDV